jgi:DNA-binding Lrp family transcriptional regulator
VDALDIRILRAMGIQPYGRTPRPLDDLRPASIARRLGASAERVRARIEKMESSGLIEGYDLYPNYRHLGLEATWFYYLMKDEDAAEKAAERLEPVEGVAACCWFMGGMMCVNVLYRSPEDLSRKLRLLVTLAGHGDLHKLYDVDMPDVHRPLARIDWQILKALRGNALRPLPQVAREAGASAKTVRRRLAQMGREGSFFPFPLLDLSKAEGAILFYLAIHFDSDAATDAPSALVRDLDASLLAVDRINSPHFGNRIFLLSAGSTKEVNALRRRAAGFPGVAKATPLMFVGVSEKEEWIDEGIAERLRGARP